MSLLRKYHFIFVSSIFLLYLTSLVNCRNKQEVHPKVDSISVFKNIKLKSDSNNIILKVGSPIKLLLTKDTLMVELISAIRPCAIAGCASCDIPSKAKIKIIKNGVSYTLPEFDLGFGGCINSKFDIANCKQNYLPFSGPWLSFNNLIFSIRELLPYPKTLTEANDLAKRNEFYINLIILNNCNL